MASPGTEPASGFRTASVEPLAALDRRYARYVLDQCGGNKARAAMALGVSRATLYKLLEPLAEKQAAG